MVNILSSTTQFIVIGMAAFCISFGVIYSLIFCYKSRRKNNCSEENERLRDELLREKFIARRKSTSLTSPPLSDSVVNPNYNASPYKVPTRHLRSTSASYSPTHYLSPHHRRNSTPTQPPQLSSSTSVGAPCSCCGAPRGITKSKSPSTASTTSEHSITFPNTSLSSSNSTSSPSPSSGTCSCKFGNVAKSLPKVKAPNDCFHPMEEEEEEEVDEQEWDEEHPDDFLSTHKCKLIPVLNHPKALHPPSKLALDNGNLMENGNSGCGWDYDRRFGNQKSFSFGPIPPARKARKGSPIAKGSGFVVESPQNTNFGNYREEKNSPVITFTAAPPPTFTTTQANLNVGPRDCEDWEEKQPLICKNEGKMAKIEKGGFMKGEKNDDNDCEKADKYVNINDDVAEKGLMTNGRNVCKNNNSDKRKVCHYSEKGFKKESKAMDEIPYYIEQREMDCN